MLRLLGALGLVVTPVGLDSGRPDGGQFHEPGRLTFEEVAVESSDDPRADTVFLTIWNGTTREAVIADVQVSGYANVWMVDMENREIRDIPNAKRLLTIPPRSEIIMTEDTYFLRATRDANSGGKTAVTISMADGRQLTAFTAIHDQSPAAVDRGE